MFRFTITTVGLVLILLAGIALGGTWALLSLLYITVFTFVMDRLALFEAPDIPEGSEFPAGNALLVFLGGAMFTLQFAGVWMIAASEAAALDKILIFFALSLFLGQVCTPAAHELIHRTARGLRRLGVAMYCWILFGHHSSAHVLVHHVHAASANDPNSARKGEGFYRFALRAWRGSFLRGWQAETKRHKRGLHPYRVYGLWSLFSLGLAFVIAGWAGVAVLFALSSYAQIQLLLSDYVQHYGLRRRALPSGRLEPVGPQHSWNAPHGFSAALMLNAPRHSDHHTHPLHPYPALELDRTAMPILPHSLPVMAVLALAPPIWRRVMDPRVARWETAD
ncbi:MAG: alkane 1-monooxygenase [Pelagimonas sp.]|jgi:alkane 1-monooxygenase|nr:alkane 1-monooxygenase [Pelagimonas sp.]